MLKVALLFKVIVIMENRLLSIYQWQLNSVVMLSYFWCLYNLWLFLLESSFSIQSNLYFLLENFFSIDGTFKVVHTKLVYKSYLHREW